MKQGRCGDIPPKALDCCGDPQLSGWMMNEREFSVVTHRSENRASASELGMIPAFQSLRRKYKAACMARDVLIGFDL
jgi:hypothetical protein